MPTKKAKSTNDINNQLKRINAIGDRILIDRYGGTWEQNIPSERIVDRQWKAKLIADQYKRNIVGSNDGQNLKRTAKQNGVKAGKLAGDIKFVDYNNPSKTRMLAANASKVASVG